MHRRVMVTEGAGLLGSHLWELLLERSNEVPCVDRLNTGRKEDLVSGRKPDISRTRTLPGWEPRVGLDEGLERTIADFAARTEAYA